MATFHNPLYSLPSSSPFAEPLWTSWSADDSPVSSHDDGNLDLDSSWQPPLYSVPDDFYCLPFDKWSGQPTTPLSSFSPIANPVAMGQFSDNRIDITNWVAPTIDTFAAPVLGAHPVASSGTPSLTPECNPLHDCSSAPSRTTTPSRHSSPSKSSKRPPPPTRPSTDPNPNPNGVAKTSIRCWEHSCGGRAFSSLGNYERHLREKSGRAKSFACEQCGQRFTRSTAKNKHIRYGRCRVRRIR